jgi:predicted nucleotidyltransferase component of viral defense system
MIGANHTLTPGYVARHAPAGSNIGLDIAVLDIAEDFLLAHLVEREVIGDLLVFKGGTALRKLYAGAQGRFSTDLDFAVTEPTVDRTALAELVATEVGTEIGPFRFEPSESRGRWQVRVTSSFADPTISIKIDIGPPCWLVPERRPFVPHDTHRRYGFELPPLVVVRLEEILAEKIARLTRIATARDASDLVWAATTAPHFEFSTQLVRSLAMLKVWVDNHGLGPAWQEALAPRPFEPDAWFSPRARWDDEQIGHLAHPPPSLSELEAEMHHLYSWLGDLTEEEQRWARANARDRSDVLRALRSLKGSAMAEWHLW